MKNMINKNGYTRGMYNPKSTGLYICKMDDETYRVIRYSNETKSWENNNNVIAWIKLPLTEIECPF